MRYTRKAKIGIALACAFATSLVSVPVHAGTEEVFPSKPIRIIVPFPAGQGADTSARALAKEMGILSGQPVIVENRPGGNNIIGVKAVTTAPADGYTLFYGTNSPMAANAVFFKSLGYDPVKDFAPIAMFSKSAWVLVTSADSPHKSFSDLISHSQSHPSSVTIGVGATGYQLAAILMASASKMNATMVPYKGTPQAIQDVIGSQITVTMSDYGTMRSHIASGRVRPLLVLDNRKIPDLPDVPSLIEAKLDIPTLFSWTALFAHADTPKPLVARLASLVRGAVSTEDYVSFIVQRGGEISYAEPAALRDFQQQQIEDYRHAMSVGHVEPQ